jgi:ABC-type sugar transport system substrate-binding protein
MAAKTREFRKKTMREAYERQKRLVQNVGRVVVFVVSMGSALIAFREFGINWQSITIAALSCLLMISLLANAVYILDIMRYKHNAKHIAFLTPSSGDQPFYTAMLYGLIRNANLLGQNYVIIPAMPPLNFETASIWGLFSGLEDRQVDIDGIVFIPDQPDKHFDELVGFYEQRGEIPLVLVDVYFDLSSCDDRTKRRLPSFVGGDEMVGGRTAADIVVRAVGGLRPEFPTVLVINGADTPWERQRTKFFKERLLEQWRGVRFLDTPHINYSRHDAFETTLRFLREAASPQKTLSVSAIFACNDDMAIGARGAISRLVREGYTFDQKPQIVGYDGIKEIREYLNDQDDYIAGTVDVRIEEQAKAAILLMHKLIRAGQRHSEIQLIAPVAVER